jgi:coenzyme F420-reducing hydrogenase gamma subunit
MTSAALPDADEALCFGTATCDHSCTESSTAGEGGVNLHDALHERLGSQLFVCCRKLGSDAKLVSHGPELVFLVVHGSLNDVVDRLVDELDESTDVIVGLGLLPLASLGVKEVLSPEAVQPLLIGRRCLGSVCLREPRNGKRPCVETGREGYCALQ